MFKNLLTLLKKIKYELTYILKSTSEKNRYEDLKNFRLLPSMLDDIKKIFWQISDDDTVHSIPFIVFGKDITPKIDETLSPFDDFCDFKFNSKKLKPAYFNKADVKVPYEKSRFQFLQLMIHPKGVDRNIRLPYFDIQNLPRIFWNSPMDVAIRNINLIFYYLHFIASVDDSDVKKYSRPEILEQIGDEAIKEHYEYIINNLENTGNVVGNHYLVELTSILLTLANFKFDGKEEQVKYFINELELQINEQFYDDGTNFESSTHYSAFVTEALIICKLSIEKLDKNHEIVSKIDHIIKSNRFFLSLMINNKELSQIGDNDSGKIFYKFHDEHKPLQIDWLINLIDKIYQNSESEIDTSIRYLDNQIIEDLNLDSMNKASHTKIKIFNDDFVSYGYKQFGLFIWRNEKEFLSIRCGPIGQNGYGGHAHYDQLSIECFTNNSWIARDPGTGTYTNDIETRNNFRSLNYHWGPKPNIAFPKEDEFDCFKLKYMSDGEVLQFDKNNFLGFADFNGKRIYRKITFNNGEVSIEDFSNEVELEEYISWGEQNNGTKVKFSDGYKRVS